MADKIKIKKGSKANLPILDVGEFAFCLDTKELFIGSEIGNYLINSDTVVDGNLHDHLNKESLDRLGISSNGNITIDGVEISNMGITKLSELTDVDSTNKINGYVLSYDSVIGKTKYVPLPTGTGSGATNLDGLSDVDVATVTPTNGDNLVFNDGLWKPSTTSNNLTYTIELERWGITKGLPSKTDSLIVNGNTIAVYSDSSYLVAKNNAVGINEAFKWAYDNGYRTVVFPNGEYSICYGKYLDADGKTYELFLYPQKDTDIDFNNSVIKVIYDSDKLSPYNPNDTDRVYKCPKCGKTIVPQTNGICPTLADPVVGDCGNYIGFYNFASSAILIREPNVHIKRIKLIGDRADRSFSTYYNCINNYPAKDVRSFSEAGVEWTTGVEFADRADSCSITDSDIAFFMGDNISTEFVNNSPPAKYASPLSLFATSQNWGFEFGSISTSTGLNITSTTNEVRTNHISIPSNVDRYSLVGLGFQPRTAIPNFKYNVYFYDTSQKLIAYFQNARTVDVIYLPKASSMRISFIGDGTVDGGVTHAPYWTQIISGGISNNILISRNNIRGGHRGGLFLGGNNVNIEYNDFISNGSESDLYGLVMFPYMTRYGINSEDNVGQNYKINNNVFSKSRIAVAIRGEYMEMTGNEFRHNVLAMTIYRLYHANISENTFIDNDINDYPYNELDFVKNWNINGNTFMNSSISFGGLSPLTSIQNNTFNNSDVSILSDVYNFSGNTFVANKKNCNVKITNGFKNCSFVGISGYKYNVNGNSNIDNCYFNNSDAWYSSSVNGGTIKDSKFINSSIVFNVNNSDSIITVKIYDCTFDYNISKSVIPNGATVGVSDGYSVEFYNCKLRGLLTSAFEMQHIKNLYLYGCDIKWNSSTTVTSPLCKLFYYQAIKLVMNNCSLDSIFDITQDLSIFSDPCKINFVELNKFTFTPKVNDFIQTGNMTDNLIQALADIKTLKGI